MTELKTQLRGNCQCCGRDQAVQGGRMSKHGYEVKSDGSYAYFSGVCSGHSFPPMQVERKITDSAIESARKDADHNDHRAQQYTCGEIKPAAVSTNKYDSKTHAYIKLPFSEGDQYQQRDAIKAAIYQCEMHARAARSWANDMEALVNKYHGTPLRTVVLEAAPAKIQAGEKRQPVGSKVLTSVQQDGSLVYYTYESKMSDGSVKKFRSKTTSTAWRKYPLVG